MEFTIYWLSVWYEISINKNIKIQKEYQESLYSMSAFSFFISRFVWKTIPSKARVTRDKVSGHTIKTFTTVWKTVPK